MKNTIKKTLYFINNIDGVDQPPYAHTVENVQGTSFKVEENHVDDSGAKIHTRAISKEEFDAFWDEQEAIKAQQIKDATAAQKKLNKNLSELKESAIKKLVSGEKLTEEEAKLVAGNLGM